VHRDLNAPSGGRTGDWAFAGEAYVIVHVVLFRPRATLSQHTRESLATALATAVREIPTIRRARVGRRIRRGYGYEKMMRVDHQFVAILEFDDDRGLEAYLEHSAHERLAECFFSASEEALMYDYEVNDGPEGIAVLL
jgi:hypothetical protein